MLGMRRRWRRRWHNSRASLVKFQIARRRADHFIGLVHVYLRVLSAVVYDCVHYHSTTAAGAVALAVNSIALDDTPPAARPPVLFEFVERILRVILRMLLPIGIFVIDAVCGFVILFLQRGEKVIGNALF